MFIVLHVRVERLDFNFNCVYLVCLFSSSFPLSDAGLDPIGAIVARSLKAVWDEREKEARIQEQKDKFAKKFRSGTSTLLATYLFLLLFQAIKFNLFSSSWIFASTFQLSVQRSFLAFEFHTGWSVGSRLNGGVVGCPVRCHRNRRQHELGLAEWRLCQFEYQFLFRHFNFVHSWLW